LSGEELPPPSHASRAFSSVILKACSSNPDERYASASEMKKDLEEVYSMVALSMQEHRDYRIDEKGDIIVNMENYSGNENKQQSQSGGNASYSQNTNVQNQSATLQNPQTNENQQRQTHWHAYDDS
jgi:serine/threonine protein kinase